MTGTRARQAAAWDRASRAHRTLDQPL